MKFRIPFTRQESNLPENFESNSRQKSVKTEKSLLFVVERLKQYLPEKEINKWFCSAPGATGGVSLFPYFRVDGALICCRDSIFRSENYKLSIPEQEKSRRDASLFAMKTLLWVEVGFGGLQNLANNRASENWPCGVGDFVNDKERAKGIMGEGKEFYNSTLKDFVNYHNQQKKQRRLFFQIQT